MSRAAEVPPARWAAALLAGAVVLAMLPAAGASAATAGSGAVPGPEITGAEGTVTVLSSPADSGDDPSLWWAWIAPATGTYRFYTHGSEMDTVLTVHADVESQTPLVSNDDDGDLATSLVTFEADAGDVYAIEVLAPSDEPGLVNLAWHGDDGASAGAPGARAAAPEQLAATAIIEGDATISSTVTTGEKPQSKTWKYAGTWWAVLASSSGTWVWRHDGGSWTNVYRLTDDTTVRADVKAVGNVVHVLLYDGSTELVSLQYDSGPRSYRPWGSRSGATSVDLGSGGETATIDIDATGRMWLAYDTENSVEVQYSSFPYSSFSGPVTLETGIDKDDIAVVAAMSGGVGVMWSDQRRDRFGFRFHPNSSAPGSWGAVELPGAAYAASNGSGFADDHINVATASDGTLYAVVKTSFNDSSHPDLGLLVRRPSGRWDPFYEVSGSGTRGIVQLNEAERTLHVVYTSAINYDDILVRESSTGSIDFGSAEKVFSGSFNDATSTKDRWTGDLMILAADVEYEVHSALLTGDGSPAPQEPPPTEPTDPPDPDEPTDPAGPTDPAAPKPAPTEQRYGFFLNDAWTTRANHVFQYGRVTDQVFVGDWNGDNKDTIALRRGNLFYIKNALGGGAADQVVAYGRPGDTVLVGDWNGDGKDTFTVRRGAQYHVRNSMTSGPADQVVVYGRSGDQVLAGDWNGDRKDTLAVRRGSEYHIKNTITGGKADQVVVYGRPEDTVLAGDWNGDRKDTLAVRRGSEYHVKDTIAGGKADLVLVYGRADDEIYVGDWNGDRSDTLGVRRVP
ncbi:hypothetical protein KZX45_14395 [Georgenia sp. EYE_87]|uniref:hypothetical protein n=1 Tax=Georgenia sp. EYE_87 TaxID=2853448 RepID=UPI002006AC4B|nr:hypothetical protein [Georgenia sp. EYE_87]MCK6211737.1 hypothetical protein [Georgenia sp. EYE_87]